MLTKKLQNISGADCVINYQSLPCHVKSLATQAGIAAWMNELGVENIDGLYAWLTCCEAYNYHRLTSEKNAHFYELKLHGQPLKRKDKIEQICHLSPKASEALNHPLWHFIAIPAISIGEVANLCSLLDENIYYPVLATTHEYCDASHTHTKPSKHHRLAIKENTHLDGYLMHLIWYFAEAKKYRRDAPIEALMDLFRVTLCFLAFRIPRVNAWNFYYALTLALNVNHIKSPHFPKHYAYWPEKRAWLEKINPPKFFGDVQDYSSLMHSIRMYRERANWLASKLNVELSTDLKIRLLSSHEPYQVISASPLSKQYLLSMVKQRLVQF